MPNIGDQVPAGVDAVWVQLKALQQQAQQALSFAASAQAVSSQLAANVATQVAALASGGTTWHGPVSTTGAVAAATVSATGAISGASLASSGPISSPFVYSNSVASSSGNRAVWMDGNGGFGYNTSSRRFKEQIETSTIDYETLMAVRVVWFKYIESVERYGNDDAERHLGAIAEEVHDLGLFWMVDYDEDGLPFGLKQERFGLIGILLAQHQHRWLTTLQADVDALKAAATA